MAESDNILTKLHDLLLYMLPQLNKFPRDQKFVLGDRIETKLLEVQECCLRAYYGRDKRAHLLEANLQLEVTRHLIRLAHALRLFSNHTYGVISEKVDVVGRMIGGWLKAVSGANGAPVSNRLSTPVKPPVPAATTSQSRSQTGAPSQ
jgi:hypothetical protein